MKEFRPSQSLGFTVQRGYRSGGAGVDATDGSPYEFNAEYTWNFELSYRASYLDGRMTVAANAFYTDWTDQQVEIQLIPQGFTSTVILNAGSSHLYGGELESQAILGGGFGFTLAAGYIDAEYTSIDPGTVGITLDSELPKTPEFKINVGPTLDFNLGNGGALRFAVDYTYTDDMENDSLNTPNLHRPSSENLNAAIRYQSPEQKYEVVVGGTNLTDDRYLVTGSINEAAGEHVGTYNPPRQWYVTFRVNVD